MGILLDSILLGGAIGLALGFILLRITNIKNDEQ